jgi:alcohol dehydrogenase
LKAVLFKNFGTPPTIAEVATPDLPADGVIIRVRATGICRSDWHAWQGHDPDIPSLPHIGGHEFSGTIEALGNEVRQWNISDRVTAPFVCACGTCADCNEGNAQVCPHQHQPGFTAWGSFAEYVAIPHADFNLVRIPDEMDDATAASLGCRFATAYRAVVTQGAVQPGQWVAIHGCGGAGLSAIMIAKAHGAKVIGIDISPDALTLAKSIGADVTLNGTDTDIPKAVHEITQRGAHISIDALGAHQTCANSIRSLRNRGRHVQIGLLLGSQKNPPLPMGEIVARELEIFGSHGMSASEYPTMLANKNLHPEKLIQRRITIADIPAELTQMGNFATRGLSIAIL